MRGAIAAAFALALATVCSGQRAETTAHFAVVSVKRDSPGYRARYRRPGSPGPVYPGGKFWNPHALLYGLVEFAYPQFSVPGKTLVGLPPWAYNRTGLYDVRAEPAPGQMPSMRQLRLMMRSLLKDRFALQFHVVDRVMPVYFLEIAKGGVRNIVRSRPGEQYVYPNLRPYQGLSGAEARAVTMSGLASYLAFYLQRPTIDRTGMIGKFDINVKRDVATAIPERQNPEHSFIINIRKILGLELLAGNVATPVMVVDHVERPRVDP